LGAKRFRPDLDRDLGPPAPRLRVSVSDSGPAISTASRCHVAVRAKPRCGAAGACRLDPNHGKTIGTRLDRVIQAGLVRAAVAKIVLTQIGRATP
jgi:hypothetical protein